VTQILMIADSLSGTGHQRRAEMLCQALLARGHAVTYLSHTLYERALAQAPDFRYVELPPYADALDDPAALLAVKMERMRRIARLRGAGVGPFAALICEHYPIGKFYLDEEVGLLRKLFKTPATRQLCVYRDIIDDGDLAHADAALARLNRDFDALLVLADPKLLALPPAFVAQVQIPIAYLGYLDPRTRRKLLVFGGGGKLNDAFYQRTLAVLRTLTPDWPFDSVFYTGGLMAEDAFAALAAQAGATAQVRRSTPDLFAELAQAAITISTLGYNTFVDLLHFNNANILVPLAHNDEQRRRADLLAAIKANVQVIELDDGYEAGLTAALTRLLAAAPDMEGARNFVRTVEEIACLSH
jgi:predicted glycosyltransferase